MTWWKVVRDRLLLGKNYLLVSRHSISLHCTIFVNSPSHVPPLASLTNLSLVLFLVPSPHSAEHLPTIQSPHLQWISKFQCYHWYLIAVCFQRVEIIIHLLIVKWYVWITWARLSVTVFCSSMIPFTFATTVFSRNVFCSDVSPTSSSTGICAVADDPLIPFTMNYIVNEKWYSKTLLMNNAIIII